MNNKRDRRPLRI